jgi:hypothetical protein
MEFAADFARSCSAVSELDLDAEQAANTPKQVSSAANLILGEAECMYFLV